MSQINVNTINEYAINNGVTIDGVLIKDSAIASSYISGLNSGITTVDMWRLTADVTSSGVITANLTQNAFTNVGLIGTGMSESSGIFTFSSTGIWQVGFQGLIRINATTSYGSIAIETTNDATNYSTVASAINYGRDAYSSVNVYCQAIFDITDTSNQKIRFNYSEGGTSYIDVDGSDRPNFFFIRLGDT